MARRKSINDFQVGRAGRAERLRREFPGAVRKLLQQLHFEPLGQVGVPDYKVLKGQEIVAYFEAEFPDEGRWPRGGEFKYETIRWPERKWDQYCAGDSPGVYQGKPLFMISIRGDLGDAYYMDARTWCAQGNMEHVGASVFRGFPKTDYRLGKGLDNLEAYTLRHIGIK